MKKVNMSPRAQVRRQRALQRFTVKPITGSELDKSYQERKAVELAALKSRLGVAA